MTHSLERLTQESYELSSVDVDSRWNTLYLLFSICNVCTYFSFHLIFIHSCIFFFFSSIFCYGSWSHSGYCRGHVPGGVGHWCLGTGSAGRQFLTGSRRMIELATAPLLYLIMTCPFLSLRFFSKKYSLIQSQTLRISHFFCENSVEFCKML